MTNKEKELLTRLRSITLGSLEFWSPQERDRELLEIDQELEIIRKKEDDTIAVMALSPIGR